MKTFKPSWRSWLARQSHNLKVVSSSLTEGILLFDAFCYLMHRLYSIGRNYLSSSDVFFYISELSPWPEFHIYRTRNRDEPFITIQG